MIVKEQENCIETYGDIKEFKTSINPKDLGIITTLLSSNLYSNPQQSFIREIVSNAWDSHVEAGTTNLPVIISIENNNSKRSITIRDYGTGLSPEIFKEVYCNIGSSTKRDSNEYIGGFGIGKYSSLACSNIVYITSYYNKIAYNYIMIKESNTITTNLVNETKTDEKNGVEVTIKDINDISPYISALKHIIFFENIYVRILKDGIEKEYKIPNFKKFENFYAADTVLDNKILLGNVLYPYIKGNLPLKYEQFLLQNISSSGIVLKFEIGELDITPNRESIIYNISTIEKIKHKIDKAIEELDEYVKNLLSKNVDDIKEYIEKLINISGYDPFNNRMVGLGGLGGYKVDLSKYKNVYTFRGTNLYEFRYSIRNILNSEPENIYRGFIGDNCIYNHRVPYSTIYRNGIKNTLGYVIIDDSIKIIGYLKQYLIDKYTGYSILSSSPTYNDLDILLKSLPCFGDSLTEDKAHTCIKGILDYISKKPIIFDLDKNPDYLNYREKIKSTNKEKGIIGNSKPLIIYKLGKYGEKIPHKFDSMFKLVIYLKDLKRGIILGRIGEFNLSYINSLAVDKEYVIIEANQSLLKKLKELNLRCFVDTHSTKIKTYLNEMYTISDRIYKLDLNKELYFIQYLLKYVNDLEREEFTYILDMWSKKDRLYQYSSYEVEEGYDTTYIDKVFNKLLNYLNKYKKAYSTIYGKLNIKSLDEDLISLILLKNKDLKINKKCYNNLKSNKLIKYLCNK